MFGRGVYSRTKRLKKRAAKLRYTQFPEMVQGKSYRKPLELLAVKTRVSDAEFSANPVINVRPRNHGSYGRFVARLSCAAGVQQGRAQLTSRGDGIMSWFMGLVL